MRLDTSIATGEIAPEDPHASPHAGIEPSANPPASSPQAQRGSAVRGKAVGGDAVEPENLAFLTAPHQPAQGQDTTDDPQSTDQYARTLHHSLGYADALPIDPEDIKRREYLGISSFVLGLLALLSGVVTLVFLIPLSIVLLSLGCAAAVTGMLVLANIPNIVTLSEASA